MWLFVPSGTIPSIRAQSPAIEAAIEVIGETVVAIRGRVSPSLAESEFEPELESDEQAAKVSIRVTAMIPYPVFFMTKSYCFFQLLQIFCNCRPSANTCRSSTQRAESRIILSSDGRGSPRPSVLLVTTHSEPSGACAIVRSRPLSPRSHDFASRV